MSSDKIKPAGHVDDYEAKYMQGSGRMLRREKTVWKLHWLLLLPMPLLLFVLGTILTGAGSKPAPMIMALLPVALMSLFSVLWLMFRVLRVHVTEQTVHIQYGIFGPQIPVAAITSCRVIDYPLSVYGGWGIRYGLDGSWAYSLAGDSGRVVEIRWKTEDGKEKKVVVSSLDPDALAASIQAAQAQATPRLRAPAASALEGGARDPAEDEALLEDIQRQEPGQRSRRLVLLHQRAEALEQGGEGRVSLAGDHEGPPDAGGAQVGLQVGQEELEPLGAGPVREPSEAPRSRGRGCERGG
jgi:hypothetical protein